MQIAEKETAHNSVHSSILAFYPLVSSYLIVFYFICLQVCLIFICSYTASTLHLIPAEFMSQILVRRFLGIQEPTCQSTNRFYLTESSKSISVLFCPLMQSTYAMLLHMKMEPFRVWEISLGFGNWAFSFFLDPINIWSKAVGLPVTQGIKIIIWNLHSNPFIFNCFKEWSY